MQRVAGSMSTSTGLAPVAAIASSVAMNVLGTVTTSRPGCAPSATSASRSASVPSLMPTQWAAPQ
jgi:hypothetical protein